MPAPTPRNVVIGRRLAAACTAALDARLPLGRTVYVQRWGDLHPLVGKAEGGTYLLAPDAQDVADLGRIVAALEAQGWRAHAVS